jgi:DNA polymerase theta
MTRLYEWQMEALAQPGVLDGGSLVYSAPTSAGKSLVADVLLLRALQRSPRRGVLVVLPYNALCDEKAAGLERLAKPLNVPVHRHYSDRSGPLPSGDLGIIVCTFEKANAIVARLIEADRLCAIGCVVVDELHMLSGKQPAACLLQPHAPSDCAPSVAADEGRGPTLESLCSTLLYYSFIDAGKEGDPTHPSPALSSQQLRLRNANLPVNECRRASCRALAREAGVLTRVHSQDPNDWHERHAAQLQRAGHVVARRHLRDRLPAHAAGAPLCGACRLALSLLLQALKPLHLQHGNVMLDSDGLVVRTLEVAPSWKDANDGAMVQLVQETIDQSGSVLVFCASKNDTVSAAKLLAEHLKMPEPPPKSQAPDDLTREEGVERLNMARPAEKQLPHLAACVAKGVAFHNSLLNADEREVVQDCFRFGKIRVICCTSTLAAGVNLPARLVILRQDYGYGSDPGSTAVKQVPLQPAQYQQMAGRAGRTGLDEKGESIILAKPRSDAAHVVKLRKLVLPDPRPLTSALASEAGKSSEYFKLFVLYAVSSGLVVTNQDMKRYVECTLLATLQTEEDREKDALRLRFNTVAQELFGLKLLAKDTTVRCCCALCVPWPASHATPLRPGHRGRSGL